VEPFPKDQFLDLNGLEVSSEKEGLLIVDNLGVCGCTLVEAGSLLQNYFTRLLAFRSSLDTQEILQQEKKVGLVGGAILKTENIIIRKGGL
jgi:hypothetical protein